jgi:hypothetical protein
MVGFGKADHFFEFIATFIALIFIDRHKKFPQMNLSNSVCPERTAAFGLVFWHKAAAWAFQLVKLSFPSLVWSEQEFLGFVQLVSQVSRQLHIADLANYALDAQHQHRLVHIAALKPGHIHRPGDVYLRQLGEAVF